MSFVAVTVPPAPVAVTVNVCVPAANDTLAEPFSAPELTPVPETLTVVAFVVVQTISAARGADPEAGEADRLAVGAGGGSTTVTVCVSVAINPPPSVAEATIV